ncbi:MAG: L-fucose/L-arabinose isomerase family protein [Acidimicrobiales bacterium]|nr:L-fucose/L-arabinose isomerase family protein [Acidimicrobiales bacterium]
MVGGSKIGILTFSDGRDFVHQAHLEAGTLQRFQDGLRRRLEADGHEVVAGEFVWSNATAVEQAQRLAAAGCDATVFNFCVWSFPHLPAIAARFVPQPILLFSNINPSQPGMVGFLAAAGTLNQLDVRYTRAWGAVEDDAVFGHVRSFVRAARVVKRLRGQTYGLFGGRPMGMYTAVSNPDQWMRIFGIDIEHIDQWEIVRGAERVPQADVDRAIAWLETHASVEYDGAALTPETLGRQIRSYYAVRRIVDEQRLDFCGIKAQPELTNAFCTMDVTEAFMNDPYDWDGPKPITVCATEADTDGALTMQVMKELSGTPVLFADVRHLFESEGIFDLVNSGQHATYFAARSQDPAENLAKVRLLPQSRFFFPAGGAAVHHLAAPGHATFARFTRLDGRYWLAIVEGDVVQFDDARNEALMRETTYEWPHAFVRFACSPEAFLSTYAANHIHAIYGSWTAELRLICEQLGIEVRVLS